MFTSLFGSIKPTSIWWHNHRKCEVAFIQLAFIDPLYGLGNCPSVVGKMITFGYQWVQL